MPLVNPLVYLKALDDAGTLLHAVAQVVAQFEDFGPEVGRLAADVAAVFAGRSAATVAQLTADLHAAWDKATADYTSARDQVAAFLAAAKQLVADL